MSETEWLTLLKCRATGLAEMLFVKEWRCSANLSGTSVSLTDVKFIAFPAGYAVNDVRESVCEIMPDNKFGFGSKNDGCLTKRSVSVTADFTARKSAGW